MKAILSLLSLLFALALFSSESATAHGGAYRGPGGSSGAADTAPPAADNSGAGSTSNSGPSSTGGAASSPGPRGGSSSRGPSASMPQGPLQAEWEPWWAFNKDPFLNLKAVIHHGDLILGSDNYFLGHAPTNLVRESLRPSRMVVESEIVPALLRVLAAETDNDLVTGVQVALAKIGVRGPETSEFLQHFLDSPNQEIAETAAVSLGILADPGSVDVLLDLLFDTKAGREAVGDHEVHWRTRAFAAYGLGLVGFRSKSPVLRRRVIRNLTSALEGPALALATPDVAVACLTAIGLVPLSEDPNCALLEVSRLTPTHCRRGQLRWLINYSTQPKLNYMVRAHIPTALARLVQDSSRNLGLRAEVMVGLIGQATASSAQRELRESAIGALGAVATASDSAADLQARATLTLLAKQSREAQTRTLAVVALGQVGGRLMGVTAADQAGIDEVRGFLVERFKNGRSSDRPWVALALALLERRVMDSGLDHSSAVAELLHTAFEKAKAPRDVGSLAISLGVMREVEAADALQKKLLSINDDRARGYICIGLGLMNARGAVGTLREILEASRYRPLLLRETAISLGLLGDKSVVDDLIDELREATSLTAQASIASALGTIGDARSIPPLLRMLEDRDLNVRARAFAAVALGIVADKEPLPWNAKIAVGVNYNANTPTLTDGQGSGILDIL
ncbi:MAG TPA: hypothetical protein EYQ59_06855 [Planctomycetes bacterium]|nr:hypothetical protein [Planctomycetota bacterium]